MSDDQQAATNSKAVIFFRLDGGSEVLWWQGDDFDYQVREAASTDAMDLGFERETEKHVPPLEGFRVWEGRFVAPPPPGDTFDPYPDGAVRDLTAAEWDAVREGRNPFSPAQAPPVDWRDRDLADAAAKIERLELQLAGCGVAARGEAVGEANAREGDYGWSRSFAAVQELRAKYSTLVIAVRGIANGLLAVNVEALCEITLRNVGEPLKRSLVIENAATVAIDGPPAMTETFEKYQTLLGVVRELAGREPTGNVAADVGPATCRLVLRTIGEWVDDVQGS